MPRYVHARGPLPSASQGAEPVNTVTLSRAFRRERSPSSTSSCALRSSWPLYKLGLEKTDAGDQCTRDDRWRWKFFGVCKWKQASSWSQVSVRERFPTDVTRVICIVYFGDWVGRQIFITRFESLEYFLYFKSVFIKCLLRGKRVMKYLFYLLLCIFKLI